MKFGTHYIYNFKNKSKNIVILISFKIYLKNFHNI